MKRKNHVNISDNYTSNNCNGVFVEYNSEDENMKKDYNCYCDVYKELCQIVGEENMRKIYMFYKGVSVQFPQGLYSKVYIYSFIEKNMDTMKASEIAKKFSLTERRIRQIIKEIRERN